MSSLALICGCYEDVYVKIVCDYFSDSITKASGCQHLASERGYGGDDGGTVGCTKRESFWSRWTTTLLGIGTFGGWDALLEHQWAFSLRRLSSNLPRAGIFIAYLNLTVASHSALVQLPKGQGTQDSQER